MHNFHSLLEATTKESLEVEIIKLAKEEGFETTTFAAAPSQKVRMLHSLFLGNFPVEFLADYEREKFHQVNPLIPYCHNSSVPILFRKETYSEPRQAQLFDCAVDHKMRSGVTFPMHGPDGTVGAMAFMSDRAHDEHAIKHIHKALPTLSLIKDFAFEAAIPLIPTESSFNDQAKHLSDHEIECLKWTMAGKTSWEISVIIGKAEMTVNYHMNNLMAKLNVSNRQQAVIKAVRLGLIHLD